MFSEHNLVFLFYPYEKKTFIPDSSVLFMASCIHDTETILHVL